MSPHDICQLEQAVDVLLEKWKPVQIADQVVISHEAIYRHVC
jgi:hypothetical protein